MRQNTAKRWALVSAIVVTLGFIPLAAAASTGATDETKTPMIERHVEEVRYGDAIEANVDWAEGEIATYEFLVPAGSSYALTVDWVAGEFQVDLVENNPADRASVVPLAGCISDGLGNPSAQPGVGVENCTGTPTIEGSITNTTTICATDGSTCETDAHSTGWSGYLFIGCSAQHVDRYQWPGASPLLDAQQCQVFTFGESPADWGAFKSGSCGRTLDATDTVSRTGCIHE